MEHKIYIICRKDLMLSIVENSVANDGAREYANWHEGTENAARD